MVMKATTRIGLYYYFLPTYRQGKKIIWDGITIDGRKFIDYIPDKITKNKNGQEMKVELINGSIIQIIGTDRYDSIRGTNPIGCVFSEFAFQNPTAWEIVKPILKVNGGWAVFNTTPNGKNHAYDMYNMAKDSDDWFSERLSIEDTGVLTRDDMDEERAEGMSEEMIQQEYYCSFDIGALGGYYGNQVKESYTNDRICSVPVEKLKPINLYLDLGRNDSTTIIFGQDIGKEMRFVDYYENSGHGIDHYVSILREKGYNYGIMWLPHDAFHKRLESNKSIAEQFKEAGFTVKRVKKLGINHGIQEVRKLFPRMWFDKEKCKQLIRAIENYHKEWDDKKKVFKDNPLHDWSSHASDALRYRAVSLQDEQTDDYEAEAVKFIGGSRQIKETYKVDEWAEYQRAAKEAMNDY